MLFTLKILMILLLASIAIIDSAGTFYEEISNTDGNTVIEESMHNTPIIHKTFHQCTINKLCSYVIKNMTNGNFAVFMNEDDLPRNRTRLLIWRKLYHGIFNDCKDAYNRGNNRDGIFKIMIPAVGLSKVRCDMTTAPRGWIVFQRRVDANVDFYRNWQDYRDGFGSLDGNFWLGLEKLHRLAAPGRGASLRVDLKHISKPDELYYAEYSFFEISSESDGYRLEIGGYSGIAGDDLTHNNKMKFTTKDREHKENPQEKCADAYCSALWCGNGAYANFNGIYSPGISNDPKYISWYSITKTYGGIAFCEMKIRI